ncbi:MAG: hypothetical protein ABMB14_21415 [Myxococcota bacterium]
MSDPPPPLDWPRDWSAEPWGDGLPSTVFVPGSTGAMISSAPALAAFDAVQGRRATTDRSRLMQDASVQQALGGGVCSTCECTTPADPLGTALTDASIGAIGPIGGFGGGGGTAGAKLSAAPGDDGRTDPEEEAAVQALNDFLSSGLPEEAEFHDWTVELQDLLDDVAPNPPCERFEPPVDSGTCTLRGTSETCSEPCLGPVGVCDVATLPCGDVEGLYELDVQDIDTSTFDTDWLRMVKYAWAVLYENVDLVEWVACRIYGEQAVAGPATTDYVLGALLVPDPLWVALGSAWFGRRTSLAQCLSEKIRGMEPDITIRFLSHISSNGAASLAFGRDGFLTTGRAIRIGWCGYAWSMLYDAKFKAAAAQPAERFCIVVDLAASLLHELVHTCNGTNEGLDLGSDGDDPRECTTTYLTENAFRWAMSRRYPCLADTANCGFYTDNRMWVSDSTTYPGNPPWVIYTNPGATC